MLTREAFERQAAWPQERVHGWAPGNYSCTCGDCGIHYVGDKRSVQCYPCAAKFVPPPRPETIEEIRADRDALRAELDRTKGEMERVRKSQLRRLDRLADQRCDELLDLDAQDTQGDGFYWRWFGRMVAFRDACRAALERKADA